MIEQDLVHCVDLNSAILDRESLPALRATMRRIMRRTGAIVSRRITMAIGLMARSWSKCLHGRATVMRNLFDSGSKEVGIAFRTLVRERRNSGVTRGSIFGR